MLRARIDAWRTPFCDCDSSSCPLQMYLQPFSPSSTDLLIPCYATSCAEKPWIGSRSLCLARPCVWARKLPPNVQPASRFLREFFWSNNSTTCVLRSAFACLRIRRSWREQARALAWGTRAAFLERSGAGTAGLQPRQLRRPTDGQYQTCIETGQAVALV